MASILNATTTSGLVTSADNSGSLQLQTNNGTTAVTINTSQQVGIGTTTPSRQLQVESSAAENAVFIKNTNATTGTNYGLLVAGGSNASDYSAVFKDKSETDLMKITGNGLLQFNSGYGSVATAYGCRAWANWNGSSASPITPRSNGNVSSVTKNSTGDFTVNFTNAMPDDNYSVVGTGQRNNTNLLILSIKGSASYNSINTGSVNIRTTDEAGNLVDALAVCIAVFR